MDWEELREHLLPLLETNPEADNPDAPPMMPTWVHLRTAPSHFCSPSCHRHHAIAGLASQKWHHLIAVAHGEVQGVRNSVLLAIAFTFLSAVPS